MIHPDTEVRFISAEKGYGLVATKLIPKGTITWVNDALDQLFTREEIASLPHITRDYLEKYCFTNKNGDMVLCGDNGKYVNHSFTPSCFSTPYDFEIAIRDIAPGEELTDDYGYLNVEKPFPAMDEGTSRTIVYPDDILNFHKEWDALIKENAPKVFTVPQPLRPLIPESTWNEFAAAAEDPARIRSIRECHYEREAPVESSMNFRKSG
jgi:uncharacterized protein